MPLYWVFARAASGVTDEAAQEYLKDHLKFQFDLERRGLLFAAGPLGERGKSPLGMYCLIVDSEEEAQAIADRDPFHVRGRKIYELHPWTLCESSVLGVATRAWLNGTDPSFYAYWPRED